MNVNIFDEAPNLKGEFKKWTKVGDSLQGTFVDVYDAIDTYNNPQKVFVLIDSEGKTWNVGFRLTNVVVLERMEKVALGQNCRF